MKTGLIGKLSEYNRMGQKFANIYSDYAASHGIAESVLSVLYSVYLGGETTTQTDICEQWSASMQTVNSCLKKMEKDGLLRLSQVEHNRRKKKIVLTSEGELLAKRLVVPLVEAENAAFLSLDSEEQELLFSLTEKHLAFLKTEIEKIE